MTGIGVEEEELLQYLNNNEKATLFPPTYEFNKLPSYPDLRNFDGQQFTQITEMKKISSYQILKDLQIISRFELIRSEMI